MSVYGLCIMCGTPLETKRTTKVHDGIAEVKIHLTCPKCGEGIKGRKVTGIILDEVTTEKTKA